MLDVANSYTGGTTIGAGTLEIASGANAGAGAIDFAGAAATLRLDAPVVGVNAFANPLAGVAVGDRIDLAGLAFSAAAGAPSLTGGVLTVFGGAAAEEQFQLTAATAGSFTASSDGAGGTMVTAAPSSTITVKSPYQTVNGTPAGDLFLVASYNDTLNGEGGSDLFSVQNTSHWYNSYSDLPGGSATLQAGVAAAFIGLTNFAPGNGVTTIDTNGYAGVEIGGNGSSGKLDLSGVTIDGGSPDTATILANQSYQTVTGPKQNETFDVASYNGTLNGEGGSDLFSVQNTAHWYNSYSDLPGGSATLQAGVDNAFIGLTNFAPGNGVTTIDTNGYAGVEIGGNGGSGKLDLSGVTIDGGSPDTAFDPRQPVLPDGDRAEAERDLRRRLLQRHAQRRGRERPVLGAKHVALVQQL